MSKLKRYLRKHAGDIAVLVLTCAFLVGINPGITKSGWMPGFYDDPIMATIKGIVIAMIAYFIACMWAWAFIKVYRSWRDA